MRQVQAHLPDIRSSAGSQRLGTQRERGLSTETPRQRAWVVVPVLHEAKSTRDPQARAEEAVGLTQAIDLDVLGHSVVQLRTVRPATLIGTGRLDEISTELDANAIDLVIVDGALTPVQQRNLETHWSCKVIDRTGLILEIFGERAATREGVLQVELAALTYQRSRLVRSWTHLERQRGGLGFIGGPGERQIELDRRRIDERITLLKGQIADVQRTRTLHRNARQDVPFPVVALVGYTNAGKSTLFNRLTGAQVMAEDKLFATLDPTMRGIKLPSGKRVVLSDTVGFITDLPTDLIAAFRATLEEVLSADLLLHVRAVSHPDFEVQANDVHSVLNSLGINEDKREAITLEAWNKVDAVDEAARPVVEQQAEQNINAVPCSALTGEGLQSLLQAIDKLIASNDERIELTLGHHQGGLLSWLHDHGRIVERHDEADGVHLAVELSPLNHARLQERMGNLS